MNTFFSKPLDAAFYTGIAIILIPQFLCKRIKRAAKEKANQNLENLQTKLKSISISKLGEIFFKHSSFMLIVFLNGLFVVYIESNIYQHQMLLDGKQAFNIRYDDLLFMGCLVTLVFILKKVKTSFHDKQRNTVMFKIYRILISTITIIFQVIVVINIYDFNKTLAFLSHFQEAKGTISIILEGIAALIALMIISTVVLSIILNLLFITV